MARAATLIPVRPEDELDWPGLERHLRSSIDLPADRMSVRQFVAGSANLTYLLEFGASRLVLRRPPRGTLAPGAHDMAREYRVLSRLGRVYPRAPLAVYFSDDASIIGAPFVLQEFRDGEVIRDEIPESMAHHADVKRRVCLALIDAAADLHGVDADRVDLGDLGRPDGFGDRQVAGWRTRWERAAPSDASPTMHEVAERLAATVPRPTRASIVHNDLKLDNCQFDAAEPDLVASVFDWDMATLGDPLFDLGLLFTSMATSPVWVLSSEEAVERYARRAAIDVTAIDWYRAFATWRTAVVMQQLYNRYRSGDSVDERLGAMGDHISSYATRARALLT